MHSCPSQDLDLFDAEEGSNAQGSFMLSPRRMSQRLASLRSPMMGQGLGSAGSPLSAISLKRGKQVTRKEAFGKYSTENRIAAQARVG